MKVLFGDLRRQYESIREEIDSAIQDVLERGWFVLGSQVERFESEFADYTGVRHAIGVGSGTEAIHLALIAAGVEPGDEVIMPANTCVPTVSGISSAQAVPVLVDVESVSFNMDPALVEAAITSRTKAILPVHLYGQAADLGPIIEIANGIPVIEDAAQGHGATYKGRRLGAIGKAGCFSFYPSKNLGAYGDGGAVVTDDDEIAARLRRLRNYGEDRRYYHTIKGVNSRLDEMQAAILQVKLKHLEEWNSGRREIAAFYNRHIDNAVISKPVEVDYGVHNYHLYVIRCNRRDELQGYLSDAGITTLIHYPVPVHLQESYSDLNRQEGDYPIAEKCAKSVLSLPLFPELREEEVSYVVEVLNSFK